MTIYVALAIMFLFRMVIVERSQSIPGEDQNTLHKDKSAEGNWRLVCKYVRNFTGWREAFLIQDVPRKSQDILEEWPETSIVMYPFQ